jgi:hypothetical protein
MPTNITLAQTHGADFRAACVLAFLGLILTALLAFAFPELEQALAAAG